MQQSNNGISNYKPSRDVYTEITNHIVEAIEKGADSFQMPWHRDGFETELPCNAKTKNEYSGINILSLWVAEMKHGYGTNLWGTYKQWKSLDAQVRKGEKGNPIVFYKEFEREAAGNPDETEKYRVARASWVFNADQVDGFSAPKPETPDLVEIVEAVEQAVKATNADIRHGGSKAFFTPSQDYIQMPDRERFAGTETSSPTEAYYSTLLHELTHWSGHEKRLDRDMSKRFEGKGYAMEELVAELGASYLCSSLDVSNIPRPDHAAYIAHWLEVMKEDKKAVFTAASNASKATDYVLGFQGAESDPVSLDMELS